MSDPVAAFDAEAGEFAASLAEPWNRLKYDLAWANLTAHLPAGQAGRALDAGGGTGALGLRLAARGYDLTLLDPSPAMLALAAEQAARQGLAGRCRLVRVGIEALPEALGDARFDVILCHNVLEYVADPTGAVRVLATLLEPGGVLSLLAMNRDALPLQRLLLRGEPEEALAVLGRREFQNRFGIVARTLSPAELRGLARDAGLREVGWYGVRMFYDYTAHPRKTAPDFYDAVKRLELAARATDPYRLIGRDAQVLAAR